MHILHIFFLYVIPILDIEIHLLPYFYKFQFLIKTWLYKFQADLSVTNPLHHTALHKEAKQIFLLIIRNCHYKFSEVSSRYLLNFPFGQKFLFLDREINHCLYCLLNSITQLNQRFESFNYLNSQIIYYFIRRVCLHSL